LSISIFDIFKIGIGPSSSHTMGPMRAAARFADQVHELGLASRCTRVAVQLYGSLALTGQGHCTDRAVMLGLEGYAPDTVDPDSIEGILGRVSSTGRLKLAARTEIAFDPVLDLLFVKDEELPGHTNGMRMTALDEGLATLVQREYYSIGGGFIVEGGVDDVPLDDRGHASLPYRFDSGAELVALCRDNGMRVDQVVVANECVWRSEQEIDSALSQIWSTMQACVARGMLGEGTLPGRLKVRRRAARMARDLQASVATDPMNALEWVNVWALAVNEENAAGGRVVTAPTNGAAGIIPAVLHYYQKFIQAADRQGIFRFLLTAGAVGILYKKKASISGAEMGCQGEVGVACSMAAAGLVAARGGTAEQIENAAEIGMEHNLGLTCDPVAGLVQIPCIERNAMGAVKAINAASLALRGDGKQNVSLDQVIATMRQTGLDMARSYKETSLAGLAVNVPEC